MIELVQGLPPGVTGFRITDRIAEGDYRDVVEPALRAAAAGGEIRLLMELGDDIPGVSGGAMREDWYSVVRHWGAFRRLAVVTPNGMLRMAVPLMSRVFPGEVRAFATDERTDALAWLAA